MDLCKKIEPIMTNNHMYVEKLDDFNFKYTYKMTSGISNVKGGLKVLSDLQYPQFILDESIEALKNS